MIDVHSHIVFDVDDGPKTLEESLDLIGESYAQGVRKIVSTSHRRKGMFETPEDKIFANFSKVKAEAEALYPDLTIYYGGELYYTLDIVEKLEKNLIPRMHNTQFALIEFSARTSWK
ncbi:tyrosine protein phosphatase, partial [Streptococcus thermophilus]|nr:tyrosine protein phosphatase [Streptococcus thermophilus]